MPRSEVVFLIPLATVDKIGPRCVRGVRVYNVSKRVCGRERVKERKKGGRKNLHLWTFLVHSSYSDGEGICFLTIREQLMRTFGGKVRPA